MPYLITLAIMLVVGIHALDIRPDPTPAPTLAPGNVTYSFTFVPTLSSWEFQLESGVANETFDDYNAMTLNYYQSFAMNASNNFATHETYDLASYNITYWAIVDPNFPNSTEHVLMKARNWLTGSRAGTTDVTLKVKHNLVGQWTPLPNQVPGVKDKLENDVHCPYNGASYSVKNPNVQWPLKVLLLQDLLPYFSSDLAVYLNLSLNSSVIYIKRGFGKEAVLGVTFNKKMKGFIEVAGSSTMVWEQTTDTFGVVGVTAELSIRVKRWFYNDLDLLPALQVCSRLFTWLIFSTIDDGSTCNPPPVNPTRAPLPTETPAPPPI